MLVGGLGMRDHPIKSLQDLLDRFTSGGDLLEDVIKNAGLLNCTIGALFSHLADTDRSILRLSSNKLVDCFGTEQKWEQVNRQNGRIFQKFDLAVKDMRHFMETSKSDEIADVCDEEVDHNGEENDESPENSIESEQNDDTSSIPATKEFAEIGDVDHGSEQGDLQPKPNSLNSENEVNFFSVKEMERFADMCEGSDCSDSDDSRVLKVKDDDYTQYAESSDSNLDNPSDSGSQIYYGDFFADKNEVCREHSTSKPLKSALKRTASEAIVPNTNEKRVRFSLDKDQAQDNNKDDPCDDEELNQSTPQANEDDLSKTERKNLELIKEISRIELQAVSDKHWLLRGEVKATDRESNSLLEHDIETEFVGKAAPIITEEVTVSLEDIIKDRIKHKQFDDPIRKAPPILSNYDPNKAADVEAMSKKSLVEIYEEDYMKKVASGDNNIDYKTPRELEVEDKHKELTVLYESIVADLNALSNLYLTPRAAQDEEFKLKAAAPSTLPSLMAEEMIPSGVSDANAISHKEKFKPVKHVLSDKDLTSQQKKRIRDRTKKSSGRKRVQKLKLYAAIKSAQPLRKQTKKEVDMEKEHAARSLSKLPNVKIIGKYDASKKKKTPRKERRAGSNVDRTRNPDKVPAARNKKK